MTAYLSKIINSLVLLVRKGTQGEKLYIAAADFKISRKPTPMSCNMARNETIP